MPENKIVAACFACLFGLLLVKPVQANEFVPKQETTLKADGPNKGKKPYALIQRAFGKKSIESPDLYKTNHNDMPHIIEAEDSIVGPHFVFLAHRDQDHDRGKGVTDRQRNEIKTYDKSKRKVLAYEGDVMQYRWKFKIDTDFEFSQRFTHFFQVKARNLKGRGLKNGGDQYPVLTLSGVDKGEAGNEFQLRYSSGLGPEGQKAQSEKLIRQDMSLFAGQWIEFFLQVEFSELGYFKLEATNIETGERLIDYEKHDVDMWRGENKGDFSRPKWGIYRSLREKGSLRSEEEQARFADFVITKGK